MKKPELLAPAGSYKRAQIAFIYGADAVYVGTSALSLRTRVDMDEKELEEIVALAKKKGKKIYTALNIYAPDIAYDRIKKEAKNLERIGVDGVIVSDGGVIDTLKEYAPSVDIHISTQANTVSLNSAKFWYRNGAVRIVLARELSKENIEYIMANKPKDLEMEIFIHGAVCMGYSGRCLLSNYFTGRPSNIGDCAQPCRWKYNIYMEEIENKGELMPVIEDSNGTYFLSAKDLCLIRRIPEIIDMGVESLKIEGRLKTEYYVATVVNAYRKAIDDYIETRKFSYEKYLKELDKAKSRSYSELFYDTKENTAIQNYLEEENKKSSNFEYGGRVVKEVADNFYIVEIKNKIYKGDSMELLLPGYLEPISFIIDELKSYENGQAIEYINPGREGQKVLMKLPFHAEECYVIRREK